MNRVIWNFVKERLAIIKMFENKVVSKNDAGVETRNFVFYGAGSYKDTLVTVP